MLKIFDYIPGISVGCFNHSVCSCCRPAREMVIMRGFFCFSQLHKVTTQSQLPSSPYNHNTLTTLRTSVKGSPVRNKNMEFNCFSNRVVTLVANKLERNYERITLVWKTNWIRQPQRQLSSSSYNSQYTDNPQNICEGVITNELLLK